MLLFYASCRKEASNCTGTSQKSFELTGFDKIYAGETFILDVQKGNSFSIQASGCSLDVAETEMNVNNNILDISFSKYRSGRNKVHITVTMPELFSFALSGNAEGKASGFEVQSQTMRTVLSGNASCEINYTPSQLNFEMTGNTSLTLRGSSSSIWGELSGNCRLNASELVSREVDMSATGNSTARVNVLEEFYAFASGNSKIYYKGNPSITFFETNSNGEIIRE